MTIWRMRIACWIPNATNTHSKYVKLIAFPLQQSLHEGTSVLLYMYTGWLVKPTLRSQSRSPCMDTTPIFPYVHPWPSFSHKSTVGFSWNSLLDFHTRCREGKDTLQEIRTVFLYWRIKIISTRIFCSPWPILSKFDVKRLRPKLIHSN